MESACENSRGQEVEKGACGNEERAKSCNIFFLAEDSVTDSCTRPYSSALSSTFFLSSASIVFDGVSTTYLIFAGFLILPYEATLQSEKRQILLSKSKLYVCRCEEGWEQYVIFYKCFVGLYISLYKDMRLSNHWVE